MCNGGIAETLPRHCIPGRIGTGMQDTFMPVILCRLSDGTYLHAVQPPTKWWRIVDSIVVIHHMYMEWNMFGLHLCSSLAFLLLFLYKSFFGQLFLMYLYVHVHTYMKICCEEVPMPVGDKLMKHDNKR